MMSSALAIILMAAMTIPGSGPEKVSAEIERGLDLRGEWEGVWYSQREPPREAQLHNETLWVWVTGNGREYARESNFVCVDEGGGKLHLAKDPWSLDDGCVLGIYRWDGDRILLCYRVRGQARPTSFRVGDDQFLLILHHAKPGK